MIKDDAVTELYLAIRDAYPTKALAHTRVLALSGITYLSLALFHESLSKQVKNVAPIDTYFYSDSHLTNYLNVTMIPRLMELTQYTRPSRLVFIRGFFKRDGFKTMLDWMVANAALGYFKNLKYFQVSEHNIQDCVDPADAETLEASIVANLKAICEDKMNFPMLETINLNNNGYQSSSSTGSSEFAQHLRQACPANSGVEVTAQTDQSVDYPKMCGSVTSSYFYYDLEDEAERSQCRYTWNWELNSDVTEYAAAGPFPNLKSKQYCPTPEPTPTPEPWFPIYDPFIQGDNCNYANQTTCFWDVIKDDKVTELYLAIRDAYPTKALAHTRVLALSGITYLSLALFHESLSKQVKNVAPIDTYFYSDSHLTNYLNVTMIPRLMELTQYTRPSRLVFIRGFFKRDGFKTMLDWMVANAALGYFKNLKYFQVSEHNIQDCVDPADAETLEASIVANLKAICEDKMNFPMLQTINLNNNGYNEGGGTRNTTFAQHLRQACPINTNVEVSAWNELGVAYTKMCGDSDESYGYYDLEDEAEREQCRFTWNWELKSTVRQYAAAGPFPNRYNICYCPGEPECEPPSTSAPTVPIPTTVPPPTVAPTVGPTQPPRSEYDECWSSNPVKSTITQLTIAQGKCNSVRDTLDLSRYPHLKSLTIGNNSFQNLKSLIVSGLKELTSVVIGELSLRNVVTVTIKGLVVSGYLCIRASQIA